MGMSEHEHKPNRLDPSEIVGTSAVAHVGKTLESDPEYDDLPQRGSSDMAEEMSFRGGTDLTAIPNTRAGSDPLLGTEIEADGRQTEPLITRLSGDTSSDPHTDLGPDNASVLQDRNES